MKNVFDEATNTKLLQAKTKAEISSIIAETPNADKYADKIDLIMNEIEMINGIADDEILDEEALEHVAGGAKRQDVYLSETQGCIATFYLWDQATYQFCWSNDQCGASNEYKYHYTKYSNCKSGTRHVWQDGKYEFSDGDQSWLAYGHWCTLCNILIEGDSERFNS